MKGFKTFTGIAILVIPQFLKNFFDIEIDNAEMQSLFEQISIAIGTVLSIYGRIDANKTS